ncbi:hypothetical protein NJH83_30260 [Pseudomonas chlororaphis]|uniref:DUF6555 family protein n=1 Tax=Pseudomonas chlororaphis TaxID=587753 RepID=UPI00209A68F5|nr:DUF6555 family protein [Pseudomonas chlororaphis]MCO7614526.1 hypothetical protein [Pseudomonas chlororaphis]
MSQLKVYKIAYRLHGENKTFVIRAEKMDNATAWHWASCDAGIGIIPRSARDPVKRISKPLAERYGLTEVVWKEPVPLAWEEV